MTALGLALVPSSTVAQQGTLKQQFVGTWTLVSLDTTASNGTKQPFLIGANPRGILILDASGRFAMVAGRPDRPKLKTNSRSDAAEFGAAAREFVANFGTWSVSEADKTLTQHREAALSPNTEGTDAKDSVSLAGDELKLTGAVSAAGSRVESLYRRAK